MDNSTNNLFYFIFISYFQNDLGHIADNVFMELFFLKNLLVHKTTRLALESIIYLSLNNDYGFLLIVSSLSLEMMLSRGSISVWYK